MDSKDLYMENRKIVSDREQKEWYSFCPLRITRNTYILLKQAQQKVQLMI